LNALTPVRAFSILLHLLKRLDPPEIEKTFLQSIDKSPADILQALLQAADRWGGHVPQNDDITCVVYRFH
jgi:serine phosphatase RsbU (regulator of sigma subunit)